MKVSGKRFSSFFKAFTAAVALVYLLSVASYYFSALVWWPFGILPIAYYYLAILLAVLALWWFWLSRKTALILSLIFLVGFQPFSTTFSFGKSKKFRVEKAPESLRVMQWNVMSFPGTAKWWDSTKNDRARAFNFLARYNPDIICTQDFTESVSRYYLSNISFFIDTLHYPYMHAVEHAHSISRYAFQHDYTIIFSRLPFIRTGSIPYQTGLYPEHIVWVDVNLQGKEVRVISTHFKSINLFSHKDFNPNTLPYHTKPDSAVIMSPNMLKKLKYFQALHAGQAEILRSFIDTCSIPVVLAADLNSVPAGYVFQKVKGDLSDGSGKNEFGAGATFNYLLPNLRIDYLLHDKRLTPVQWKHFEDGFFDHDHILADLEWKRDN